MAPLAPTHEEGEACDDYYSPQHRCPDADCAAEEAGYDDGEDEGEVGDE